MNEYFDKPLKLERKDISEMKKDKNFSKKIGFSLKRKLMKLLEGYPISFKIKIWFRKSVKNLILEPKLQKFFKKKVATRRELFNDLWNYIKKNNLMHKNIIRLDDNLKEFLTPLKEGEDFIALEDIAINLKKYCESE